MPNHKNSLYKPQTLSTHQLYLKYFTMIIFLITITRLVSSSSAAEPTAEDLLLTFKASLSNAAALGDWDAASPGPLCIGNTSKWTGLTCFNGNFRGLRLEGMGLGGVIDVETLARVPGLRSLSVANNSFEGPVPRVRRLSRLWALYLSNNRFSGEIPGDGFKGMKSLKKLHLGKNGFVGKFPKSIAKLDRLIELNVEGNRFEGKIPNFPGRDWKFLSFADNLFSGRIPASLSKIDQKAFLGNKALCGAPLGPCESSNKPITALIIAFSVAVLISAIALIAYLRARRARAQTSETKLGPQTKVYKGFTFRDKAHSSDRSNDTKKSENGNLHFVRNEERFDLEDLLRASAEVLGSGSFGSSYKAALFSGPALVVKRFRHMSILGRDGFQAHMSRLGRLAHPNVLSIIAYYYTKEEKLLISHFAENGSLASHLHGKRAVGQQGLDWATRLKIIKGVSKGLSYLYREFPELSLPHGNLKSSNVLIDGDLNPLLSDYALAPLISKDHARQFLVAHKSPESSHHDRVTNKTDVWSLGILILELLTGKFPTNFLVPLNNRGTGDLVAWVKSVVQEEWMGELFDNEMGGTKRAEGQMFKLLKIGMCCCESSVEQRWDWQLAAERIEELRERNDASEETEYSSYVTDWDVYSSSMMLSDDGLPHSIKNL